MTTVSAPSNTPAAPSGAEQARLPRSLGLLNAISNNMSNMVDTGPFITVPAILATLGGRSHCWLGWWERSNEQGVSVEIRGL